MDKPRWELKIGTSVLASDGKYGRLKQVILDPHQERVVALLVRQRGLSASHTIVVPEEEVAEATDSEVRLKISQEQADALPEYQPNSAFVVKNRWYEADEESFAVRGRQGIEIGRSPTAQRPGLLEDQLARPERAGLALELQAGHQVFCSDGPVGKVSLVLVDPQGRVKGFVMHAGHLPGRNLIVPVAWVQEVDRQNVHLSVEKRLLKRLLEYFPDFVLAAEVENALWVNEILRVTDYNGINVTVENGIVILRGHVVTPSNRSRAEDAARSVTGVLGIENHLVVDEELVVKVAQALGTDKRTCPEYVFVGAQRGVIILNGDVASAAIREAAEEVAASVPEVRGVVNYLRAPQVVVDPEKQQALQPPIGREVYATDMFLGCVERVIIDPHNRRVTAFVTSGNFTELLLHTDENTLLDENPQRERHIVVPVCAVDYETDRSVMLAVSAGEAAQYRDFNPANFVFPPEGWQPPYPYHWEDVLFERKD